MKASRLAFAILGLVLATSVPVGAEDPISPEKIVQALKPRPLTRGVTARGLSSQDAVFLNAIKRETRGLTLQERNPLADIVATAALPSIEFEIKFAFDSANLEPGAIDILRKLAVALQTEELANASFLVAGHTDGKGARSCGQT